MPPSLSCRTFPILVGQPIFLIINSSLLHIFFHLPFLVSLVGLIEGRVVATLKAIIHQIRQWCCYCRGVIHFRYYQIAFFSSHFLSLSREYLDAVTRTFLLLGFTPSSSLFETSHIGNSYFSQSQDIPLDVIALRGTTQNAYRAEQQSQPPFAGYKDRYFP